MESEYRVGSDSEKNDHGQGKEKTDRTQVDQEPGRVKEKLGLGK